MSDHFTINIKPRFRDTDGMGHVNNAVFITYIETARSEWFQKLFPDSSIHDFDFIIARIEMDYRSPILLRSEIEVKMWVSRIGNSSWDFSYTLTDVNNGILYAEAKSIQVSYDYNTNSSKPVPKKYKKLLEGLLFALPPRP